MGHRFKEGAKRFFKKFLPLWIVLAAVGIFCLVDFVNYSGYDIAFVKATNEENPEGDPEKLYYPTPDRPLTVDITMRVTHFGKPVCGHTIVGIGESGGKTRVPREKTDEEGYVTFNFAPNTVFKDLESTSASLFFYEESSAWVIEFRVENRTDLTFYRRPKA